MAKHAAAPGPVGPARHDYAPRHALSVPGAWGRAFGRYLARLLGISESISKPSGPPPRSPNPTPVSEGLSVIGRPPVPAPLPVPPEPNPPPSLPPTAPPILAPEFSVSASPAAVVVSTALAQVGKPYEFGAAGPSSFDCSGLVLFAYAAAGVSLPRTADAQSWQGVLVASNDELMPGDLVGFYGGGHIGIYVRDGRVVHSPTDGDVVKVTRLKDFGAVAVSARRRIF